MPNVNKLKDCGSGNFENENFFKAIECSQEGSVQCLCKFVKLDFKVEKNSNDVKIVNDATKFNRMVQDNENKKSSKNDCKKPQRKTAGCREENTSNNSVEGQLRIVPESCSSDLTVQTAEASSDPKEYEFLEILKQIQREMPAEKKTPEVKEREAMLTRKKKILKHMKTGSQNLNDYHYKLASENYKCALDLLNGFDIEVFGLSGVDRVVLKYALCVCWIQMGNYDDIILSIEYLKEIEANHASVLPAVYWRLGEAFHRLNRFKIAVTHLENGMKFIQSCGGFLPQQWPGTTDIIRETKYELLMERLNLLWETCKMYHVPDAVCIYEECLNISTHEYPSELIYFNDPDFVGYVKVMCQQNCKMAFHIGCWKNFKERLSVVGKLSDKDVLGQPCLTDDCVIENNVKSMIIQLEVYGVDGNIKTFRSKDPTKVDINEHRKQKKKKNLKTEKLLKVKTPHQGKITSSNSQTTSRSRRRKTSSCSETFADSLKRLDDLREINFGCCEEQDWDPQKNYFGRTEISGREILLNMPSSKDSKAVQGKKEYILTYFYEYIKEKGAKKISAIEKEWLEEVSLFPEIRERELLQDGICYFLLQSQCFACIGDYMCLADQVAETYKRTAEEVREESLAFILRHCNIDDEIGFTSHVDNTHERTVGEAELDVPAITVWDSYRKPETFDKCHDIDVVMHGETGSSKVCCPEELATKRNSGLELIFVPKEAAYIPRFVPYTPVGRVVHPFVTNSESKKIAIDSTFDAVPVEKNVIFKLPDRVSSFEPSAQVPEMENGASQIVSESNLQNEIQALKSKNQLLEKEIEEYKIQVKINEEKISKLVSEKQQDKNIFQHEIETRDASIRALMKKHCEEIQCLMKVKEENGNLLKINLENMVELHKEIVKHKNSIKDLKARLEGANEMILHILKLYGECKLNSYLVKCCDRLHFMNVIVTYFQDFESTSVDEIKTCIADWENVTRILEDKDFLQVQQDIWKSQLQSEGSERVLQFELSDMPVEPYDPLQDMKAILQLAEDYTKKKISSVKKPHKKTTSDKETPYINCPGVVSPSGSNCSDHDRYSSNPLFSVDGKSSKNDVISCIEERNQLENGYTTNCWSIVGSKMLTSNTKTVSEEYLNLNDINTSVESLSTVASEFSDCFNLACEHTSTSKRTDLQKTRKNRCKFPMPYFFQIMTSAVASCNNDDKVWNYPRLIKELKIHFKNTSEDVLSECVDVLREENGNTLSGVSVFYIIHQIEHILKDRISKKIGKMGIDTFGDSVWSKVKEVNWQNCNIDEDCIICYRDMKNNRTTLQCNHVFHFECIRKWLRTNSTCPICRQYVKLDDEFPPLV